MITLHTISAALHSVKISDGTDTLAIAADGSIAVTDNGASLTVDATNLDIRDLTSASDSIAAVQSGTWTIDSITNAVTVSATNLDIRDLASGTDSVSAVQSGTWNVNTTPSAFSSMKVTAESITSTASQVASTPLAGRLKILIQNLGDKDVYLKENNTVSSSNSVVVPKGGQFEEDLDDGATIWAVVASGTVDLRVVEYKA